METESKLSKFNNTLDEFVADLEGVIQGDPFLQKLAGYLVLKSSNARFFITPSRNMVFVRNMWKQF